MRYIFLTVVAAGSILLAGCSILGLDTTEDTVLHVHIQEYFDNEEVRVTLNDKVIFDHRVRSTRAGSAVIVETGEPAFLPLAVKPGMQHLRVWVDGVLSGETAFVARDTLWVGIGRNYERTQIILSIRKTPFTYW